MNFILLSGAKNRGAYTLKMNQHYKDESAIYKSYKDMNDWLTGKRMIKEQRLHQGEVCKIFLVASYVLGIPKRWLRSC